MRTKKIFPLLIIIVSIHFSCNKNGKTDEPSECKTCKAFANASAGLPEVSQQACSDAAIQSFREEHKLQEVTCY